MGASLVLYPTTAAEKIEDLNQLNDQLKNAEHLSVNLYKIYEDILIILTGDTDNWDDPTTPAAKWVMGNTCEWETDYGTAQGFLSHDEIKESWAQMKLDQLETLQGFVARYQKLPEAVKSYLQDDLASDEIDVIFHHYWHPLTVLYAHAAENEKSICFLTT